MNKERKRGKGAPGKKSELGSLKKKEVIFCHTIPKPQIGKPKSDRVEMEFR